MLSGLRLFIAHVLYNIWLDLTNNKQIILQPPTPTPRSRPTITFLVKNSKYTVLGMINQSLRSCSFFVE